MAVQWVSGQGIWAFFLGFVSGFVILLLLLVFLRLTLPYSRELFGQAPIPYHSIEESTDWLNFIVYRVLTHLESEESLQRISRIVSAKLNPSGKPRGVALRLISLGNAPTIPKVSTLKMPNPDDIKILIPIEWTRGPSLDLTFGGPRGGRIEVDLSKPAGRVLFSWPGGDARTLRIRFDHDFQFDLEIALVIRSLARLSLTGIPLLGPVLKGIVVFAISRQVFEIDLPLPTDAPVASEAKE
jgi:hypothetical protein